MAINCTLLEVAEYAVLAEDKKLTIAGIYDSINIEARVNQQPPAGSSLVPGLTRPIFLVASITASVVDGLKHTVGFGLRHEDGEFIIEERSISEMSFNLNREGRPMKHHSLLSLSGISFPRTGDYEFVLFVDGIEVRATPIYYNLTIVEA